MKGGQRGPSAPKAGSDKAHWQAKTPAQDNRRGRRIMTESLPRKREGPARVAGRRGGQSGASSSGLQGLCIRRECCAMAAVDTECPLKRYEGSNSVAQERAWLDRYKGHLWPPQWRVSLIPCWGRLENYRQNPTSYRMFLMIHIILFVNHKVNRS